MCSEGPEKRAAVRAGIREDLLERVTLTLNLREVVKISKAGGRRGEGGKRLARQRRQHEQWLRSER